MAEAFNALALADVTLIAYLISNEHEEVERTLRAIVYLGDLRSEAFPDLDRLSGIMEHDMMLWFQFMADFSEVIKQERLSEESESLQLRKSPSELTARRHQSGVNSRRGFDRPCGFIQFNAVQPTCSGTYNTAGTTDCPATSSKGLLRQQSTSVPRRYRIACHQPLPMPSFRT